MSVWLAHRPRSFWRVALACIASTLCVANLVVFTPSAVAVNQSRGIPGICPTEKGVTVVIDFQDLGGTTLVRCFPEASPGTGLDALKGAGFQIAGVQRWGDAFICRIENRPSAVEKLSIREKSDYQEACIDTPPANAYWSYWWAGNNCEWTYSQWGVKNRKAVPGGFEGWSFSMNKTAESNPMPRVAPSRPGTAGQGCNTADEPAPKSTDIEEKAPDVHTSQAATTTGTGAATNGTSVVVASDGTTQQQDPAAPGAATTSASSGGNAPAPLPREHAGASPGVAISSVRYSGGEDAPDVNEVIKRQAGASDFAPWVAGGVILALMLGAFLMSRHRRRQLER